MKFVAASLPIAALVIFGLAAPAPARPHPTPTPSPSPTPVPDPAMNKSLYAPQVLEKLSDAKIAQSSQALAQLGPLTDVIYMGRWIDASFPAGARGYFFQMRCLSGNIYLWLALDAQGKIATILFKNRLDIETVTPAPSPSAPPP
jgi:hypothetical protein